MKGQNVHYPINGPIIGRVVTGSMRRAMGEIARQRMSFTVTEKPGNGGKMDKYTSADEAAQEIVADDLRECFPWAGLRGEEHGLHVLPAEGCDVEFTLDGLDGTGAFVRKQNEVGTMVAMVGRKRQEILAAYVGHVYTGEIIGYHPDSPVRRMAKDGKVERLMFHKPFVRMQSVAALRKPPDKYSSLIQRLVADNFAYHRVERGSIGTWAMRLWKREVPALFLLPNWETPWDLAPIVGISERLGYLFLRPKQDGGGWERYAPRIAEEIYRRDHETVIVHQGDVDALFGSL